MFARPLPGSRWIFRFAIVALAYYLGGQIGLSVPFVGSHITLIWPPTGIALAAFIGWQRSLWPAVWLAAFAVNLDIGSPPWLAFTIACGNTLGPWVAASLLQRRGFDPAIPRRRDLLHFLAIGVAGGMALSASNGVLNLWLAGILPAEDVLFAWITWWLGDAMGALVVGVPLLTVGRQPWGAMFRGRRGVELGCALLATLLIGGVVFDGHLLTSAANPLLFLPFLLLMWIAIRGSTGLASTAALLLSAQAVWATAHGGGPFHSGDLHASLAMLWGYMAAASITTVLITVLLGELQASESRLRQIFETNHAIKLVFDPHDGRILDANRAACEFYGYPRARLLGRSLRDIGTDADEFDRCMAANAGTDTGWYLKARHRLASGVEREVEIYAGLVGSGDRARIYAILHDITERTRVEDELLKFKFFNDNANDGYMLVNEQGRILYVNRMTCEQLGYTEAELLQMSVPDIDPHYDLARVVAHFEQGKHTRMPPFETEHRRKDGTCVPLEINSTALLVKGQWLAFTCERDITERKRFENELQKFRFFSDNANDATFLVDERGRFLYVNRMACEQLGYSEAELLRMSVGDVDPAYSDGRRVQPLPADQRGRLAPFESTHRRRDGSCFPVEILLTPVAFQGSYLRFVSARDISDRKRIEAAERRQRESLAKLNEVAALSHLPLATQLRQALAIASAQLELPFGIVSQVSGQRYTIVSEVSPNGELREGQEFELGQTCCDITLGESRVLAIAEMGNSLYRRHPSYPAFQLEAYIGAAIQVGGQVFGTVNFSSPGRYARGFDEGDIEFVALLARWMGSTIERDRAARELAASQARLQTIIDNEPEAVSIRLRDGTYVEINRAAMEVLEVGSLAEANAFGAMNFIVPEHRAAYAELCQRVFEGESATLEFMIVGKAGTVRWMDTHAAPLRDANGVITAVLGVTRDVTLRKRAESQLRLAANVFTHAHEGIMICDANCAIIDVNPTFTEITGYSREAVLGHNPRLLASGRHDRAFYQAMWKTIRAQGHWEGELWNRRRDGTPYAQRLTISAVSDHQGEVSHYIGTFTDITCVINQREQLEFLAHYDPLTKLPNRTLLADRLHQTLAQASRAGSLVAVCYLDLDGFKAVNDELGHGAGDVLLIEIAHRLKDSVRAGDTVSRLGGDEFVLLLGGIDSLQECEQVVGRVLEAVAAPVELGAQFREVSGSMGIALFPEHGTDPDVLLRLSDQAMYAAKQGGKNRFQVHVAAPAAAG